MSAAAYRRFIACFAVTMDIEGWGETAHHPQDPGGRTQFGIAARWFPAQWADGHVSIGEAVDLGWAKWVLCRCGRLPPPLDLLVFDWEWHHNRLGGVRALQEILGVEADGHFGRVSRAALRTRPGELAELVRCHLAEREERMGQGDTETFGRGWAARLERLRAIAAAELGVPAEAIGRAAA